MTRRYIALAGYSLASPYKERRGRLVYADDDLLRFFTREFVKEPVVDATVSPDYWRREDRSVYPRVMQAALDSLYTTTAFISILIDESTEIWVADTGRYKIVVAGRKVTIYPPTRRVWSVVDSGFAYLFHGSILFKINLHFADCIKAATALPPGYAIVTRRGACRRLQFINEIYRPA